MGRKQPSPMVAVGILAFPSLLFLIMEVSVYKVNAPGCVNAAGQLGPKW